MHPIWRMVEVSGHQRRADDDEAGEEHDEDRRTIAGISKAIIEPADLAARAERQKAGKQFAAATARAAACQSGEHCSRKRVDQLLGHVSASFPGSASITHRLRET